MQHTKLVSIYHRLKRQLLSQVHLVRLLLLVVAVGSVLLAAPPLFRITSAAIKLASSQLPQTQGRTNFLILGIGGPGHEAPDLTDSLVFVSVRHGSGHVTLISIPRDLWVPSLRAKINTTYHYGQLRQPAKGGLILAKSAVSEILGQPVHLAVVLDFSTFQKAIDLIGGIDVVVDTSFTDTRYPIAGKERDLCDGDPQYTCRYRTVSFEKGSRHMDGETALRFVRSRNAVGDEGTDFARARRQEKVLTAVKNRLVLTSTLRQPHIYRDLYRLLTASVVTDIQPQHYFALVKLASKAKNRDFTTYALSDPDQVYHPPVSPLQDNQWVLLPKNDDPKVIHDTVKGWLDLPDR